MITICSDGGGSHTWRVLMAHGSISGGLSHHIQRRRKERVRTTNRVGANPAIQSQWTYLPNSGLTTALRITAPPTKAPAHIKATGQLRRIAALPGFAPLDFIPTTVFLLLTGFLIINNQRFPQELI